MKPRTTPLKKSGKPIQVRKKDPSKRRFAKRRNKAFTDWVRGFECSVAWNHFRGVGCWQPSEELERGWRSDPAHVNKTRGAGSYDEGEVAPLCRRHHREQEGKTAVFNAKYGVNLSEIATALWAKYLADHPSVPHVSSEGTP